ncbi:fumarylacetoacetate hydrolase family protein [Peptoniphilus sp. MSJ-1]|uniref:Fumarylacetoacetate hydrolase family protein n=1 Tax=Peptoniphilus ovalis TaxID=2841503 RepID=A0ABS6FGE4_9FIRM|nr:fumarylacetoacetate hydrolase family protein [Peptoniphilus ovalis]MBU5668597.1 fumarylacetoacetate hydrolase family protein [Peptoniphilus ovalis]
MKLIRYEINNKIDIGVLKRDKIYPFKNYSLSKNYTDLKDFVKNYNSEDFEKLKEDGKDFVNIKDVKILSPFVNLDHDMICVGLNYKDHVEESEKSKIKAGEAENATYFSKRCEIISSPDEVLEYDFSLDEALDYETELGVIIGKRGKDINYEEAKDYVFGFTIVNDFSARNLQKDHGQWYKGKSIDGFSAMGPVIVTSDEIDGMNLDLKTYVNGELRQNSNTKYMIRDIYKLIEEFSRGITLVPGDVFATGTPKGVGMGFSPEKFLKSGDEVKCVIEGIGELKNFIK